VIVINRNNTIAIDGEVLTLDRLREALRSHRKREQKKPILITADPDTEWGTVCDVLELANRLKYWRISFSATRKPED